MTGRETSPDGAPRAGAPGHGALRNDASPGGAPVGVAPANGAARGGAPADGAPNGIPHLRVPLDVELLLPDTADTEALGERLAAGLGAGDLVVLSGPLGAGKTALVRGLARGLGVAGPVTSPTFVIAREHRPLPGGPGVPLVHVDAYRLGVAAPAGPDAPAGSAARSDVAAQLDDLDLDTDLDGAVVAVEWGEGVAERLSARYLLVRLDRRPDEVRVATVHRVHPA
jgi:tRNA threonylcarbamoyladenosine biosynthesis protein TsaE